MSQGAPVHQAPGNWRKFFVMVEGQTNGVHQSFVDKLTAGGQIQVDSPEQSDYVVVFCPVASGVAVDVRDALENAPEDKPIILVVMHHTFNRRQVVAESRTVVDSPSVQLTVDCLFYETRLLYCNQNDIAWHDIRRFLGISPAMQSAFWQNIWDWSVTSWKVMCLAVLVFSVMVVIMVAATAGVHPYNQNHSLAMYNYSSGPQVVRLRDPLPASNDKMRPKSKNTSHI
ncbi:uncharacterized protein LOC114428963 [Parambassis ranga]|uniref:Uncharacterized protein LOC114428963 n=1 Tax=Parambassis ranga TaxID=210632 RepID=A0A6P7HSN8_9TELE|nr:uncharacterized protein LOC114428963 [Parambassis ranga]